MDDISAQKKGKNWEISREIKLSNFAISTVDVLENFSAERWMLYGGEFTKLNLFPFDALPFPNWMGMYFRVKWECAPSMETFLPMQIHTVLFLQLLMRYSREYRRQKYYLCKREKGFSGGRIGKTWALCTIEGAWEFKWHDNFSISPHSASALCAYICNFWLSLGVLASSVYSFIVCTEIVMFHSTITKK